MLEIQVVLLDKFSSHSLIRVFPDKFVQSCLVPNIHIYIYKHGIDSIDSVVSDVILPVPSRLIYILLHRPTALMNRVD